MRKVIVAGSRGFTDYDFMCKILDEYIGKDKVMIVSGTARGADKLGERYAVEHGHKILPYKADWARYKGAAGFIRNEDMAEAAGELVAFWDGISGGTKHMINTATEKDLAVSVFIDTEQAR